MVGIVQVNVGVPGVLADDGGERVYSAIVKHPVPDGTVLWLSLANLAGDGQADLSVHGGPDKAVYAYPSEHLPRWADELDDELGDAAFGENLSTVGALESGGVDAFALAAGVVHIDQPAAHHAALEIKR